MQLVEHNVSFDRVYDELFTVLYKIAYRITGHQDIAEDMVQEAFIRYYEKGGFLPDINQVKYWLIRVVTNLSLNHEKRKGREYRAVEKVKIQPVRPQETGEDRYLKKETISIVQEALEQLPPGLKAVLVLKDYEGMNYKEIGKVLKITEGNVKVRVFRAREKLSEILDQGEVHVS